MLIVGILKAGTSINPLEEFPITRSTIFKQESIFVDPKIQKQMHLICFYKVFIIENKISPSKSELGIVKITPKSLNFIKAFKISLN